MKIKIKRLSKEAVIPSYAKKGDCGLDLTAISVSTTHRYTEYDTGIAVAIPEGYVGLVFPRSSITSKDMTLKNSVGVIDQSYRGSIKARFQILDNKYGEDKYKPGDRIAQLIVVPIPTIEFEETEDLDSTERGSGGFGSTGK